MDDAKNSVMLQELKFGEMLCQDGVLTSDQLIQALKYQKQNGGKIGEVLLDLGFISTKSLLAALKRKYQGHVVDLCDLEIPADVLVILPLEKMKQYEALPITVTNKSVALAMADPGNIHTLNDLTFFLGRNIQPFVTLSSQLHAAFRLIEMHQEDKGWALNGRDLRSTGIVETVSGSAPPNLHDLCRRLVDEQASDLLLTVGAAHSLKKNGELFRLHYPPLTAQTITDYARELLTEGQWEEFENTNELDFTFTFNDIGRFRINAFRQRNSISLAIRVIVDKIPSPAQLGLPAQLEEYALRPHGLILISGPTGQGKTTTLAALVNTINSRRHANIITIEDPIEYHHQHKMSNVNQREVGMDTGSFQEGLKRIFRQAPDVIVIGEIRDTASAAIAIQAASTGHLVLATSHCNNTTTTIERILELIPASQLQQMRSLLAESLLLVFNQRLVHSKDGKVMILAYEKLINSNRIRGLIRDGNAYQIRSLFQQGTDDYLPLDVNLAQLFREGKISQEEALKFCENQNFFQDIIGRGPAR
jgi:twitching motility protein PilT